jgi:hypothetical protein
MLPWQLNNKQSPILGACCQTGGYYSGEINKKPLTPLLLPEIEHPMEYEKKKREGMIKT